MRHAPLIALGWFTLLSSSTVAGTSPTRVSDFVARAAAWKQVAVAPPECEKGVLYCAKVADEVFSGVVAGTRNEVLSAKKVTQLMMDAGLEELGTPAQREALMKAVSADALVTTKVTRVRPVDRQASEQVVVVVKVFVAGREAPVATGEWPGVGLSEEGAATHATKLILRDIFEGAHK